MAEYRDPKINWHTATVMPGPESTYAIHVAAHLWDIPSDWLELRLAEALQIPVNQIRVESGHQDDRGTASGSIAVAGIAGGSNPLMSKTVIEHAVADTLKDVREGSERAQEYQQLLQQS